MLRKGQITVPFEQDDAVCFTEGIMSDKANGINVVQSLRGDKVFVDFGGKRYRVNVEDIAVAVVSQVRD